MKTAVIVILYDERETLIEIIETGVLPALQNSPENIPAMDGEARGIYTYQICLDYSEDKDIAIDAVKAYEFILNDRRPI